MVVREVCEDLGLELEGEGGEVCFCWHELMGFAWLERYVCVCVEVCCCLIAPVVGLDYIGERWQVAWKYEC